MSATTRYLFLGLFLFFLFMVVGNIWYWQDVWNTKGFALKQETSDWAEWQKRLSPSMDITKFNSPEIPNNLKPGILMRYEGINSGVLLLKHTIGEGVYSFDPNLYKTKKTNETAWQEAKGEIAVCEDQRWTRQEAFIIDNTDYKFMSERNEPATYQPYGRYALDAVISPSKTKASVLSAYGPKRPLFSIGWVGLGGKDIKIYGQRYVQIMNLDSKKYIDKPVKLHSETNLPCFSSCWSSDEKILIAYECDFSSFQIVEPFQNSEK